MKVIINIISNLTFYFILVNFGLIESKWELIFNDDFNENVIDSVKWKINDRDEDTAYYSTYISKDAVTLRDGHLILSVKQKETIDDKLNVTTKYAVSMVHNINEDFKEGKFIVRAKLAKGNWISPSIALNSIDFSYGRSPKGGKIDLISCSPGFGEKNCKIGVWYGDGLFFQGYDGNFTEKGENLIIQDVFHDYILEWKKDDYLSWFIDGRHFFTQSLRKKFRKTNQCDSPSNESSHCFHDQIGQPFDEYFVLVFLCLLFSENLDDSIDLTNTNSEDSLMIDYVRVYKWKEEEPQRLNSKMNDFLIQINNCLFFIIFKNLFQYWLLLLSLYCL